MRKTMGIPKPSPLTNFLRRKKRFQNLSRGHPQDSGPAVLDVNSRNVLSSTWRKVDDLRFPRSLCISPMASAAFEMRLIRTWPNCERITCTTALSSKQSSTSTPINRLRVMVRHSSTKVRRVTIPGARSTRDWLRIALLISAIRAAANAISFAADSLDL